MGTISLKNFCAKNGINRNSLGWRRTNDTEFPKAVMRFGKDYVLFDEEQLNGYFRKKPLKEKK